MNKLIRMTDFVLEQKPYRDISGMSRAFLRIEKYANFLKQPLELWMFVPCKLVEGVWVVLEIIPFNEHKQGSNFEVMQHYEYKQAKDKCLFEKVGECTEFDSDLANTYIDEFFNIEQLSNEIREIKLTKTAIKQLSL